MNYDNAVRLYLKVSSVLSSTEAISLKAFYDLITDLEHLRQSLSCYVCYEILRIPCSAQESNCQHYVCQACIGGKLRLPGRSTCSWCKDQEKFIADVFLSSLVRCYAALCGNLRVSPATQDHLSFALLANANGNSSRTSAAKIRKLLDDADSKTVSGLEPVPELPMNYDPELGSLPPWIRILDEDDIGQEEVEAYRESLMRLLDTSTPPPAGPKTAVKNGGGDKNSPPTAANNGNGLSFNYNFNVLNSGEVKNSNNHNGNTTSEHSGASSSVQMLSVEKISNSDVVRKLQHRRQGNLSLKLFQHSSSRLRSNSGRFLKNPNNMGDRVPRLTKEGRQYQRNVNLPERNSRRDVVDDRDNKSITTAHCAMGLEMEYESEQESAAAHTVEDYRFRLRRKRIQGTCSTVSYPGNDRWYRHR